MEEKKALKVKVTEGVQKGKEKAKTVWNRVKKPLGVAALVAGASALAYKVGEVKGSNSGDDSSEFDLNPDDISEALTGESYSDDSDINVTNF